MTLTKIVPWARKQVPVRRATGYNTPALWADLDEPWRDMERMFERLFTLSPDLVNSNTTDVFSPLLDVHETEKEFQITVEVPGMDESNLDISIGSDMLTISGEKKETKEDKDDNVKGFYRVERRYGSFSRSIPLPANCVETDKAEASYKNGVLTIKLPKTFGYKDNVKKIPISSTSNTEVSHETV